MPTLCLLILLTAPADPWAATAEHGRQGAEALACAQGVLHGWWAIRDEATGLLPQHVTQNVWTPSNAAADLYPFLVLTAHWTEPALLPDLLATLRHELALTTRIGVMGDNYDLGAHRFSHAEPDLARLIFGASEYCKDGLLPVWELAGRGVWFHRLVDLEQAVWAAAPVETPFGRLPAADTEVNGEQLQVLSRLWWATRDARYLDWANRIGEAYCQEILPLGGWLPAHVWDFAAHRPARDLFSLNDHGNEIVLGLAEWHHALRAADPARAAAAEPALRRMFDRLLEVGRSPDGLWFAQLKPTTGEVLARGTPDTWGYALCGVYTFGLGTGEELYRDAARQALAALDQPAYYDWGGADAFADSIESGLLLINRLDEPAALRWLAEVVPRLLAKQQPGGIVEGWYGDGNTARTCLMVAMYHSQGARVLPWRPDLHLGAVRDGESLLVSLESPADWSGTLHLDYPRHREHLGLPVDYPRLNQFPEWFTVARTGLYTVERIGVDAPLELRLGEELIAGLALELAAGEPLRLRLAPYLSPPYGTQMPRLAGPGVVGSTGHFSLELEVGNPSDQPVSLRLSADLGTLDPADLELPAGGTATVRLSGQVAEERTVTVTATAREPWRSTAHRVRVLLDPLLVGFADCDGGEVYAGESYQWCGRGPFEVTLDALPGVDQVLVLRWGAKGDQRRARVTVAGTSHELTHGGYDGWETVELALPAAAVTEPRVTVRVESLGDPAAFISEMRVRRTD